jgi:hypothetical protein
MPLHPAENRGYRELYLSGRQLVEHWGRLEGKLSGTDAEAALREGADAVRELLLELEPLTAKHGLHGRFAAQGSGAGIGTTRAAVVDRFLERNQALRSAIDDLGHVVTLLAYLGAVSEGRGHAQLANLCHSWAARLDAAARKAKDAMRELAADPDSAIEPLDSSPLGRFAHSTAYAMGTVGEWVDRRLARR